ncbi:MAG: 2-phosphosulfolactate phosphatase, partial [bacterium]
MKISVYFLPLEIKESELKGKVAIVIDVLRASTTLIVAISNGAKQIIPVSSIEKAYELKQVLAEIRPLLAGERNGKKLPNFDLGNSPFEYKPEIVSGKTIIYASTNGSPTITLVGKLADATYIAGFVNLPSVAKLIEELRKDVVIVCAGKANSFSLEDSICAGMLTNFIMVERKFEPVGDGANASLVIYERFKKDIAG